MLYDLFINITIMAAFLFLIGQLSKHHSIGKEINLKISLLMSLLFGLMGIVLMIYSIEVNNYVIIDLRNIAIISAGLFGGPLSVIISSLIIGLFRVSFFGIHIVSLTALLTSILIGLGAAYISSLSISRFKKFSIMFIVAMFFSNIALLYLLENTENLGEILGYYWLLYLFGAVLAYSACNYIKINNKTYKEMSYYQIMADNLLDTISTHKLDGTYIYASPSVKQLLAYKPEEMVGKNPYDLIHPEDRAKVEKMHMNLITDINEYTVDYRMQKRNGEYIWVETTFKSINNSEGELSEIICASRNISKRKKTETELKKQKEQAIEANRLKSQFLANMSHELRTPLNSIIGFTTRVLKKSKNALDEVQQENLTIVKQEANHLLSLINDLLDYSKIEAGRMDVLVDKFNLQEVINEVAAMTETLREEKNLKFKKLINSEDLEIKSDRNKIRQILINLLSNAFKYSEKGQIKLIVNKFSNYFKIDLIDQGVGIAEEDLSNIFDEFRQIDGSYTRKVGGTGLGLTITKKITEMLGGSIHVKSTLGVGSTFSVYLPEDYNQSHELREVIKEVEPEVMAYFRLDKKVVCIDDDFYIKRLYQEYLKEEGYNLIPIEDDQNIIKKIEMIQPCAIILDIMLPQRDGWEILKELKENPITNKIPVIMVSAMNEENLAYQMKADSYLIKPVTQEELLSVIYKVSHNC